MGVIGGLGFINLSNLFANHLHVQFVHMKFLSYDNHACPKTKMTVCERVHLSYVDFSFGSIVVIEKLSFTMIQNVNLL